MAFGLLLGINRERQSFERMVASRVENNWNQQFQASMLAHDKDQEIYMISLWIPGKESSEDWQTIIPELETRVKVIVFWGQRKYTFHGEVMEDIFGIGGHITCGVRAKDSSMHKLHFWQDRTVEAELVFVSDATAFNRFENTVRKIRSRACVRKRCHCLQPLREHSTQDTSRAEAEKRLRHSSSDIQ